MPGSRLFAIAPIAVLCAVLLSATTFQRSDYAAGQSPVAIVSGDFNADGKPDLAMANAGGATSISVLPGIGGGKFGPALFSDTGIFPSSLAVGDFNHDGRLDLLVHGGFGGKVAVMLGNGDATFRLASTIALADFAGGLAAADFDGDGNADFAVSNSAHPTISIYFGNGDGSFRFGRDVASEWASALHALDVTGDGKADLVFQTGTSTGTVLAVMPGNGDGTFQARRDSALKNPGVMALADFNLDSKIDSAVGVFITCPHGECDFVQQVDVYLNNGDGTFRWKSSTSMGSDDINLHAGDIDGDRLADLVVGDQNHENLEIAPSKGDGTFGARFVLTVGQQPNDTGLRDLNLDARPDLIGSNTGSNSVSVLLNVNAPAGCTPPGSAIADVRICGPAANATVTSPMVVSAAANSPAGTARIETWLDGVKKSQEFGDQLKVAVNASTGQHRLTVVAVSALGTAVRRSQTVTVQPATACPYPSTLPAVNICTPSSNVTSSSPVRIRAAARSNRAVRVTQVYIDGVKRFESFADHFDTSLTMVTGRRRVTVQAKDAGGFIFKKTIFINAR